MAERSRAHPDSSRHGRSRSRSPRRERSHTHRDRSPHHYHHRKHDVPKAAATLPYNSRALTKHDFRVFKPMFALYLDIQKSKILEDMDEAEAKGRWKSFIGKWNRGELSEGWYDPSTLHKAQRASAEAEPPARAAPQPRSKAPVEPEDDEDSDDSVGPALPGQERSSRKGRLGPSIPNMEDLELKREMYTEDGLRRREDIRYERKLDRKAQKAALDELVPRAEAGTRERQLEKKAEVNATMKAFREKGPGAAAEVPDSELMGGGDGVSDFKKAKQEFERKKNERELRKEEILRARMAEREERLSVYREKEESTMEMLKALAKQRFG